VTLRSQEVSRGHHRQPTPTARDLLGPLGRRDLAGYVAKLMCHGQVILFLLDRRFPIPSSAMLGKIGRSYVRAIERFAHDNRVPIVSFRKGESKEETAGRFFERVRREGRSGVVMIGVAQEKAMAWRGWRQGGSDGHPHFEFGRQAVLVNHYFYLDDADWARLRQDLRLRALPRLALPQRARVGQRHAERAGLSFEELDNGFRSAADAEELAAICTRLSAREVKHFFRRWHACLPSPFTAADRRRGYRYALAFRQLELSDTRVFDRPRAGGGLVRADAPRPARARAPRSRPGRLRPVRQPHHSWALPDARHLARRRADHSPPPQQGHGVPGARCAHRVDLPGPRIGG
jgi:hypothetical protein